jgi:hypothetical protein
LTTLLNILSTVNLLRPGAVNSKFDPESLGEAELSLQFLIAILFLIVLSFCRILLG